MSYSSGGGEWGFFPLPLFIQRLKGPPLRVKAARANIVKFEKAKILQDKIYLHLKLKQIILEIGKWLWRSW